MVKKFKEVFDRTYKVVRAALDCSSWQQSECCGTVTKMRKVLVRGVDMDREGWLEDACTLAGSKDLFVYIAGKNVYLGEESIVSSEELPPTVRKEV